MLIIKDILCYSKNINKYIRIIINTIFIIMTPCDFDYEYYIIEWDNIESDTWEEYLSRWS